MKTKGDKILLILSILLLVVGLLLMDTEETIYSTDEYWVAKNYRHVYEQYTGQIVDYIEEDEVCKMKNGQIIVTRRKAGDVGYALGGLMAFTGGCMLVCSIFLLSPKTKNDNDS